jgi:hypothetical protein
MLGTAGDPPVLANSFPKSGTHLLVQALEALPGVSNYDSFIASVPPIRFRERSRRTLLRRIGWIVPGELVSAHLHFDPVLAERLTVIGCIHFFIYRDLRDVAISEAHYLTYMNPWHRAHCFFRLELASDAERVLAAISGIPPGRVRYSYPGIGARFRAYLPWLERGDVCAVKFEDLVGPSRNETLRRMAAFYAERSRCRLPLDDLVRRMEAGIDPSRSRTLRRGEAGGWRTQFTPLHRAAVEREAGDLLARLGYEV